MINNSDNLLNNENIENFNNNKINKEQFFTKKRIIIGFFLSLFSITFIALISIFAFNINFNDIGYLFDLGIENWGLSIAITFFFLIFLFTFYSIWSKIFVLRKRLYSISTIRIKWYEWISFAAISTFIAVITPFAIGSEPYNIFWFKSKGVAISDISAIVASNGLLNSLSQILITWPSFFIIASDYSTFSSNSFWQAAFWLGFIGLIFDLLSFLMWGFLGYSRRVHFWVNYLLNFFKMKMKMSYLTKDEIYEKFRTNAIFKKQFVGLFKDYKTTTLIIIIGLFWNIFFYSTLLLSFLLIQDKSVHMDYFNLFNYVNVSTTANNWVPIPGGEGTLQMLLTWFITPDINASNPSLPPDIDWTTFSNSGIFIWKFTTSYIPTMCFAIFIPIEIKMLHNRKSYIKNIFKSEKKHNDDLISNNVPEDINNTPNEKNLIQEQDPFSNTGNIADSSDK